ncbi:hypothetical protein AGIG_G15793 [Arapaima gigas]
MTGLALKPARASLSSRVQSARRRLRIFPSCYRQTPRQPNTSDSKGTRTQLIETQPVAHLYMKDWQHQTPTGEQPVRRRSTW